SDEDRWARVKELVETKGLDPIEVYQVGDIYFVLDGNHRVSIARQLGAKTIQAYVKEFQSKVEVKSDDEILDVVLRLERKDLMEETKLDQLRPDVDFKVTLCGRYKEIKEHIACHRYYMGLEKDREIPMEEAAASWVDNYYLPGVEAIRKQNVLGDFPDRTETDLYLWLKKHQWELEHALERDVPDLDAAQDLKQQFGKRLLRKIKKLWSRLVGG
ncbi:MAG: ParB N-terminal domain-containing protein, partial [Gammaproteobacteria bacterium]|nr:ParB N-terminal domain-containing protein [Gammaproteobacteria bacterium]